MSIKSVLYARVSTKDQAEEGFSLSAQTKLLTEYAGRKGLEIVKQFIVPESASGKVERKTFTEMLDYLRVNNEIKYILCEKVDRITRNFKDAVKLDDWLNKDEEKQAHFVKQGLIIHKDSKSHEKLQWDFHLIMARHYSNNLSEEAKKGLTQKAEEGWYPGGRKKGYTTLGDRGKKLWVVNHSPESEAPFIKRAFEFYNTGSFSLKQLRYTLFEEGWKRKDGKQIGESELHELLTDCFYCGEFTWNGKHYPVANHESLISKELFYSVQEKLRRSLNGGRYHKHFFLFGKGLIKCGECGRSIVATKAKGHTYYYCSRFGTNCSQKKYAREKTVDNQVIRLLDNLEVKNERIVEWIRKALKESHASEIEYHTRALKEMNGKYEQIQKRLDASYDDKLDGRINEDFYLRKFEQYQGELTAIQNRRSHHQDANVSYYELGLNIFELSQRARNIYLSKLFDEKRQLLNLVFSNLTLKDGNLSPVYHPAFQILAEKVKNGEWLGEVDSNHHTHTIAVKDRVMKEQT